MSCKPIRFSRACHPETGINGIAVHRDAAGAILASDVIYWSGGPSPTNPNGNVVTALADIADYAAAQAAEQAACQPDPVTRWIEAEDSAGRELLLTVIDGVPTSAIYLDGTAYAGTMADINWVEDDDLEVDTREVCFNGNPILRVQTERLTVQATDADTGTVTSIVYTDTQGNPVTAPVQADFDSGAAYFGACRITPKPAYYPACGAC